MSVGIMIRRGAAVFAALVVLPLPGGTARAASPSIDVSQHNARPTDLVRITGSGFTPASPLTVEVDRTEIALTSTTDKGTFIAYGRVPGKAVPGEHSLVGRDGIGLTAATPLWVWTPWPMIGFDGVHSGDNTFENILNQRTVRQMTDVWRFGFGDTPIATATVAGGVAYVPVYASTRFSYVDAVALPQPGRRGFLRWKAYVNAGCFSSSAAVIRGVVYFGAGCAGGGGLFALNAANGRQVWATPTAAPVGLSSPAVVDGVIYVGDMSGMVYAFDASTGATRWTFAASGAITSPAVAGGLVYAASGDGHVYELNARSGRLVWSTSLGVATESSPAVVDGSLFVGADDNRVYALDASRGTIRWVFRTGGQVRSSPAVADGVIFIGSDDRRVYAFDEVTGQAVWTARTVFASTAAPAVANGVVYVGVDNGTVMALSAASGAKLWQGHSFGAHVATPIVADGAVCVTSFGPSYLVGGLDVFAVP
jgi:outer membrane protein assembly factor BamB